MSSIANFTPRHHTCSCLPPLDLLVVYVQVDSSCLVSLSSSTSTAFHLQKYSRNPRNGSPFNVVAPNVRFSKTSSIEGLLYLSCRSPPGRKHSTLPYPYFSSSLLLHYTLRPRFDLHEHISPVMLIIIMGLAAFIHLQYFVLSKLLQGKGQDERLTNILEDFV